MTISNDSRARVKKAFEPIARGMGRLGLTPDALTLIGFGITVVGAVLIAMQQWLLGGLVVLFGGVFDMFDGTLARATGRVSRLGAFMDSVFDRAGEAVVYVGIVVGCAAARFEQGVILAAAAMASAFMVSYTRAKSEGLGFTAGTGMAAVGIMPREIRLVVLSLGLLAASFVGSIGPWTFQCAEGVLDVGCASIDADRAGDLVLSTSLAIITVGATITTIQRILHVRSQARLQSTQNQTQTH